MCVKKVSVESKCGGAGERLLAGQGAWCPICLSRLDSEFVCPRHGEMRAFLDVDPVAAASLAVHCDSLGIVDLEAL